MFSGSSQSFGSSLCNGVGPSIEKLGVGTINKFVAKENESYRPRTGLETGIRLGTYLHPGAMRAQAGSELLELAFHKGVEGQTAINRDLLAHAKEKEGGLDVIFDRSVNPWPT